MSVTITSSTAAAFVPDLALGYQTESESLNVIHRIIGRLDPDVSLLGDALRRGELELFFLTRASAWAAKSTLSVAATFTLVDSDLPETNMKFVRQGRQRVRLDPDTRTRWILTVGYQEIAP